MVGESAAGNYICVFFFFKTVMRKGLHPILVRYYIRDQKGQVFLFTKGVRHQDLGLLTLLFFDTQAS